ncbi:MAG: class I SAM-dependent methyltransferase [Planctomycetota bacterium]|jgi:ubiquinone/menaquinone biosynthesis C-methylase UbiE|nr:class I SAM-dependent methyltransferase [Planctomycetota bacterium]
MTGYNQNTYSAWGGVKTAASRAALQVRQKMFAALSAKVDLAGLSSVLDVGATADQTQMESNFFEQMFPDKRKITALSDQNAGYLAAAYPGLTFAQGDALAMPFADGTFDLVFSNAVIEHVGNAENQAKFIGECCRVARKFVFITTPNRWHPLEFHTALPFLHWLPKKIHRKVLTALKKDDLAREENLNLLSNRELAALCERVTNERTNRSLILLIALIF